LGYVIVLSDMSELPEVTPNTSKRYWNSNTVIFLVIVLLIAVAAVIGWQIGKSDTPPKQPVAGQGPPVSKSTGSVDSLISYSLPDGWSTAACPQTNDVDYIVPGGVQPQCGANPPAPVKLAIDQNHTTDCSELQNNQDVTKHTCVSLFIGGHKTIKSITEYPKDSTYNQAVRLSDYYLDTGSGVVKAELYTPLSGSGNYQTGFDQLVNSMKVK
jgi:hypothetical protein